MPARPLRFTSIRDVCRVIGREAFNPRAEANEVVWRSEDGPVFGTPQLLFDSPDTLDHKALHSYWQAPLRKDTFLCHLRDALVVPDTLCIIADQDKVIFPNSYCEADEAQLSEYYFQRSDALYSLKKVGPHGTVQWEFFLDMAENRPVVEVEEPCVLLANQSSINYWHFMTEVYPRLWAYDEYEALRSARVIVRRKGDKFDQALVETLGIPPSQTIALDWAPIYRFKHLIYPSALCDRALTRKKVDFVRNRIRPELAGRPRGTRRFYLARTDRGQRGVLNEDQVWSVLEPHGFEKVVPSDLSLSAQADLFSQAEMLVGPHGAALTNVLFMAPGSVVVELAPRPWHPLFFTLASACGVHYIAAGSQWDFYPVGRHRRAEDGNPTAMIFEPGRIAAAIDSGLRHVASLTP
jgi:hypothetical protein